MASKKVKKRITGRRNAIYCSRDECYSSSSDSFSLDSSSDTECDCTDCSDCNVSSLRKTTRERPKKKDSKKLKKLKKSKDKEKNQNKKKKKETAKSKASKNKNNCCNKYSSSSSWSSFSSDTFSDSDCKCASAVAPETYIFEVCDWCQCQAPSSTTDTRSNCSMWSPRN